MDRRALLAGLAAMPLLGTSRGFAQDARTLDEVSKYLNQLKIIKGRFLQVNNNGSRIRGKYYLQRPGFIRFDYDGTDDLVMADGTNIGVFDAKSNSGVKKYPLRTTPLRFLLNDKIDLRGSGAATDTSNDGKETSVELRDPKRPKDGGLTLVFSNRPPALARWVTRDKRGQRTTVVLETLEKSKRFDRNFFNIELTALNRK